MDFTDFPHSSTPQPLDSSTPRLSGMIFAAGLGTRLRPLTNDRPKAMVELAGKPLLEHVILNMRQAGVGRIVVNVHHFAEQIEEFLDRHHYLEQDVVISDERDELLDTGGGLLKARSLFMPGEAVLIHNVDILSDLQLPHLIAYHQRHPAYATLAVRNSTPGRGLRFNKQGLLKGWENSITGEQKIVDPEFHISSNYSFCGIHIVSPDFLQNIIHRGAFSIIDEYIAQAREHALQMYFYDGPFLDLGTPAALLQAENRFSSPS